jgi:hypothetical protein
MRKPGRSAVVIVYLQILLSAVAVAAPLLYENHFSTKGKHSILDKRIAECPEMEGKDLDTVQKWLGKKSWIKAGHRGITGILTIGTFVFREGKTDVCSVVTVYANATHLTVFTGRFLNRDEIEADVENAYTMEATDIVDLLVPSIKRHARQHWSEIEGWKRFVKDPNSQ